MKKSGSTLMHEATERTVKVGLTRTPRKVFDAIESVTASMAREGWVLRDTCLEESLGKVHLFFEREIPPTTSTQPPS